MKHKNKYFEADREGYIGIYPSIHETKGKSRLQLLVKLLKRLKKGH